MRTRLAIPVVGATISFVLLAAMIDLIGRGGAATKFKKSSESADVDLAHALSASDLMSVSDECVPGLTVGCRSDSSSEGDLAPAVYAKPYELPFPSGRLSVGIVNYHWTETLAGTLSRSRARFRELTVSVWYPALIDAHTSVALQNVWDFSKATNKFVQAHTVRNAAIAAGNERYPLIFFYPARGTASSAYTSQIENLVSHGYIVASIDPPEAAVSVEFRDKRLTQFESDMRRSFFYSQSESRQEVFDRAQYWERRREDETAADMSFVFNQIIILVTQRQSTVPFTGRIDFNDVGAFGHASGGNAVAHFCELDRRVSACLDENGWSPDGPVANRIGSNPPPQPFMWIDLPLRAPDADELVYARLGSRQFKRIMEASETGANAELWSMVGKTYHLRLLARDLDDNNFTDGPLVWSMGRLQAGNAEARGGLAIINIYTRAFFDTYLKHESSLLLKDINRSALPGIRLESYPARQNR